MADHDGNHRCLVEKNDPIAFILPSRGLDGAESLGMETTTNCLWCGTPPPPIKYPYLLKVGECLVYFKN